MRASFKGTINILDNLKEEERTLVEKLKERMEIDFFLLDKVYCFLKDKIKNTLEDQHTLISPEMKQQACVEHLVIGLMSGDIRRKEVETLLK